MIDAWTEGLARIVGQGRLRGVLDSVASVGHGLLFRRIEEEFRVLDRAGFDGQAFYYGFLESQPQLLDPVFQSGLSPLGGVATYAEGNQAWGMSYPIGEPEYLLVCELPKATPGPHLNQLFLAFVSICELEAAGLQENLPAWQEELLSEVGDTGLPLLIQGEAGSGVLEFARAALLRFYSRSQVSHFAPGRLAEPVQLRELFGDSAGARLTGGGQLVPIVETGRAAVLVDEPGNLARQVQLRVLSRLSSGPGLPVWIFASSLDLDKMSELGLFDRALLQILSARKIVLPALRARVGGISDYARRYLAGLQIAYRRKIELSKSAMDTLLAYDWPGNLYELRWILKMAFAIARGDQIQPDDLLLGKWVPSAPADGLDLRGRVAELERELLLESFAYNAGNQVHMAESLGVSRGSLQNKMEKLGLE